LKKLNLMSHNLLFTQAASHYYLIWRVIHGHFAG
jgi:hypothetical protein